jgi:hypothetical protein
MVDVQVWGTRAANINKIEDGGNLGPNAPSQAAQKIHWVELDKKTRTTYRSLGCLVITPVNDGPLASVMDSSDNGLDHSQINNLNNTKFLVVLDVAV